MNCASSSNENQPTKEEIDRWTNSINNILASNRGRQFFQQFLIDRSLFEAEMTLAFWNMIEDLLNELKVGSIGSSELHKRLRKLYNHADEHVNFDLAQMRELRKCIKEDDNAVIVSILAQLKEWTVNLLRDEHKLFTQATLKFIQSTV